MASDSDSNGTSAKQVYTLPLVKGGPAHGPAQRTDDDHGAHGHDAHGHGGHGKDHVPHVLPLTSYLATWITLLVLTVVTVWASYQNFGSWNLIIALLVATTKAIVVAAMFMHLRYDRRFHSIIFSFSLIFLGIFIMFTMYDTETRGKTDAVEGDRPVDVATPFKEGRAEEQLKRKYEGPEGAAQAVKPPAPPLTPPQN
jgi:cytochrome c oxidase subunit 4